MARLPQPGSDSGTWGDILNDFLKVELNANGSLKRAGDIAQAKQVASDALTTAQSAQAAASDSLSQEVIDTDTSLTANSDSKVASQKATKAYVDMAISGSALVQSVNTKTGSVVLDTADIADTASRRYTNDTDAARLASTSGTNTGDQDLSGLVSTSRTINGKPLSTDIAITKANVGLGNVDDTSDTDKPLSSAALIALSGKSNSNHSHSSGDIGGLAAVATSGSYTDLSNMPTAPQIGGVSAAGSVTALWLGTEAQYQAIASPDPTTVYVVLP